MRLWRRRQRHGALGRGPRRAVDHLGDHVDAEARDGARPLPGDGRGRRLVILRETWATTRSSVSRTSRGGPEAFFAAFFSRTPCQALSRLRSLAALGLGLEVLIGRPAAARRRACSLGSSRATRHHKRRRTCAGRRSRRSPSGPSRPTTSALRSLASRRGPTLY